MKNINYKVYNGLLALRNASKNFRMSIDLFYNYLFVYFLNLFHKNNYIIGFFFIKIFNIRIYLKYFKDKGLLTGVSFLHNRVNIFKFRSLKYLFHISMYNYKINACFYMFSTIFGFLTLDDIFKSNLNCGGILYFYLLAY